MLLQQQTEGMGAFGKAVAKAVVFKALLSQSRP